MYGGRFRAFLDYFSVTSQLFLRNFSNISCFLFISHLFLANFTVISCFSFVSQPFLVYFSIIYQIFPISQSKIYRYMHVTFELFEWYHVFVMDEVCFLYDCFKAGKITKQQAKEIESAVKH